jgi:hypothetical protein
MMDPRRRPRMDAIRGPAAPRAAVAAPYLSARQAFGKIAQCPLTHTSPSPE